jgi:hypothetical protein
VIVALLLLSTFLSTFFNPSNHQLRHLNMAVVVDTEAGEAGVQLIKTLRTYWYVLLPLVLVVRFFYYKYASPLRSYPGPFLASGSRAWKGRIYDHFAQHHPER